MAARIILATPEGPLYEGTWMGPGPRLRLLHTAGNVRLFVNDDALPRAYWVPRWRVAAETANAIDALMDPEFDPDYECIVDQLPLFRPVETEKPVSRMDATCTLEDISPERVVVRVEAPYDGITVLLDTHAPGWVAWLNDRPVRILRVNGLFRGVATPSGPSVITFTYRPKGFDVGFASSLASILLAVVLILVGLLSRSPKWRGLFRVHKPTILV